MTKKELKGTIIGETLEQRAGRAVDRIKAILEEEGLGMLPIIQFVDAKEPAKTIELK